MTASILLLGLLMGMRHAIEADHVAAVSALGARAVGRRSGLWLGLFWGAGHALTLFAAGAVFLLLDVDAGASFGQWMELAVGVMLVWLGGDLIRRMIRGRIHVHAHEHDDGSRHIHVHAHEATAAQGSPAHAHRHARGLSVRAFIVGMVHGSAGSAALAILALQALQSFAEGLLYMAVFGAGSIIGMGALTALIMLPLRLASSPLTRTFNILQGGVGGWTVGLGLFLIYEQAVLIFA